MKLKSLLDSVYDEVWVRVEFQNFENDKPPREPLEVWGADWIGGYEPTLEEVKPYLHKDIDDLCIVNHKHPERKGKRVNMICGTIYLS